MKFTIKVSQEGSESLIYGQVIENLDLKALIAYLNGLDNKPKVTGYRLILTDRGSQWIPCIKELRSQFNLGLAEAKELSEQKDAFLVNTDSKEFADHIVNVFKKIGATVKIIEIYA